jgi:hypothetical protein
MSSTHKSLAPLSSPNKNGDLAPLSSLNKISKPARSLTARPDTLKSIKPVGDLSKTAVSSSSKKNELLQLDDPFSQDVSNDPTVMNDNHYDISEDLRIEKGLSFDPNELQKVEKASSDLDDLNGEDHKIPLKEISSVVDPEYTDDISKEKALNNEEYFIEPQKDNQDLTLRSLNRFEEDLLNTADDQADRLDPQDERINTATLYESRELSSPQARDARVKQCLIRSAIQRMYSNASTITMSTSSPLHQAVFNGEEETVQRVRAVLIFCYCYLTSLNPSHIMD